MPSNHGSGSYEDGIAPPSVKKQKTVTVSTIDAYEESHGHIDSDIFAQVKNLCSIPNCHAYAFRSAYPTVNL